MKGEITSERGHGEPVEPYVGKGLFRTILRRAQDDPTHYVMGRYKAISALVNPKGGVIVGRTYTSVIVRTRMRIAQRLLRTSQ